MKRISILLTICIYTFIAFAQSNSGITLESIVKGEYRGETLKKITPLADGEHYLQMNKENTSISKYSFKTGKAVETIFDVSTARSADFKTFDDFQLSPDETKLLIQTNTKRIYRHSFVAVHYIFSIKNNRLEPLSDGGPQQVPLFSPDGHQIAFVRDNNIFLVKLLYNNSESQVTTDGQYGEVLNGIPDWVNEEEFAYSRAFDFSPDSEMIAFIRFDETQVPFYSFMLYEGKSPEMKEFSEYPGVYTYKYPKAGMKNAQVSVHTFDIKSKVIRKMDLPLDPDGYIPRIRFTKDDNSLAIMTLNRHQNRFDLYFANPRSTVCKLVVRDESPYYINDSNFDNIVFYKNHFSFLSEKDGYNHLYWYSVGGNLIKQVTQGDFVVNKFFGWDEASNTFYYESNEGSPLRRHIYKIDGKGKKTRLSQKEGIHSATFSASMKYYIDNYSSLLTPPEIAIHDNNGKQLKVLIDNSALKEKISRLTLPEKSFFTFKTSNGEELNGWMIKPLNFNASTKYPVLMYQYSGPGSQEVLDRWTLGMNREGIGWETYMATQGYLVVCVDGRGTGGRGAEFGKSTYLNLGVKESVDQVETAKYLGSQSYVDKNRIAIYGWSYGGYNTIMSMSEGSNAFKAGVAIAAVTDWKYYDTIYGERFMRTPKENPEGYRAASAFSRADKLSGNLLLIHGSADDNVHAQNYIEYRELLVQQNKQFFMHEYTNRNHSIYGGNTRLHLYTMMSNFMNLNLK